MPTECITVTSGGGGGGGGGGKGGLSSWGGNQGGPLALFDEGGSTMVISPLTEFMSTVMQQGGHSNSTAVAAGLGGAVTAVPEGHSIEIIVLVAGVGIRYESYESFFFFLISDLRRSARVL